MVPSPARALTWTGRVLLTIGLVMVAFAGFQLWGTGLAEARAQDQLGREWEARFETSATTAGSSPGTLTDSASDGPTTTRTMTSTTPSITSSVTSTAPQPGVPDTPVIDRGRQPEPGQAAGRIVIPAIGLDKVFVEGVERDHLRLGPGRYPDGPWPGRAGNAAIAGHRTTHGAPFFDLDLLQPGDEIIVETLDGRFRYLVQAHDDGSGGTVGHFIVDPSAVDVLDDKGDNRLTLTACHPRYSAAQRIIVTAALVDEPFATEPVEPPNGQADQSEAATAGAPTGTTGDEQTSSPGNVTSPEPALSIDASLGWQLHYLGPTVAGAGLTAAVAGAALWMARRRNRWAVYTLAATPFLAAMFWWFTNLDKLLPAV
jgi:sortase A